jgi:cytochrome c oxidase subunit 2
MSNQFPLFPPSASSFATEMDLLYLFIAAVCAFFTVLVTALVVYFTIKYRRNSPDEVGEDIHGSLVLELTWTIIPFVLAMIMFAWGAKVFFDLARPPLDAMDVYIVGKQWMWKAQHSDGVREINELHVPIDRAVRLTMGSEDVLHDYSIPAFRVKMDVVPGKLTTLWFKATKPGTYHLYCAEYCGTKHSGMIGSVIAMAPQDYVAWRRAQLSGTTGPAAQTGERLFADLACVTCHKGDSTGRGPTLNGLYGSKVELADGRTVTADENYLRESIMNSQAKVVKGFQPIMPAFQGMVSEENLLQLIAYIKTLKPAAAAAPHGK